MQFILNKDEFDEYERLKEWAEEMNKNTGGEPQFFKGVDKAAPDKDTTVIMLLVPSFREPNDYSYLRVPPALSEKLRNLRTGAIKDALNHAKKETAAVKADDLDTANLPENVKAVFREARAERRKQAQEDETLCQVICQTCQTVEDFRNSDEVFEAEDCFWHLKCTTPALVKFAFHTPEGKRDNQEPYATGLMTFAKESQELSEKLSDDPDAGFIGYIGGGEKKPFEWGGRSEVEIHNPPIIAPEQFTPRLPDWFIEKNAPPFNETKPSEGVSKTEPTVDPSKPFMTVYEPSKAQETASDKEPESHLCKICINWAGDGFDNTFRSLINHHPNCPELNNLNPPPPARAEIKKVIEELYERWRDRNLGSITKAALPKASEMSGAPDKETKKGKFVLRKETAPPVEWNMTGIMGGECENCLRPSELRYVLLTQGEPPQFPEQGQPERPQTISALMCRPCYNKVEASREVNNGVFGLITANRHNASIRCEKCNEIHELEKVAIAQDRQPYIVPSATFALIGHKDYDGGFLVKVCQKCYSDLTDRLTTNNAFVAFVRTKRLDEKQEFAERHTE